jgi:hypothetical protein
MYPHAEKDVVHEGFLGQTPISPLEDTNTPPAIRASGILIVSAVAFQSRINEVHMLFLLLKHYVAKGGCRGLAERAITQTALGLGYRGEEGAAGRCWVQDRKCSPHGSSKAFRWIDSPTASVGGRPYARLSPGVPAFLCRRSWGREEP